MKFTLFTFCILLLLGCKKEKLNPPDEMVGEWEWVYSRYSFTVYKGMHVWETTVVYFSPEEIGNQLGYNASLDIKRNGKILLQKNNEDYYRLNARHANRIVLNFNENKVLFSGGQEYKGVLEVVGFPVFNYGGYDDIKNKEYAITSRFYKVSDHYLNTAPLVINYFIKK